MAKANPKLIQAIRRSAEQIETGGRYEWGHMGGCNCGHLAQNLTELSRAEIHSYAMRKGTGDWSEQVEDWCENSGMEMDLLISELMGNGLAREDLMHLERLSDKAVVKRLAPTEELSRHNPDHAAAYMHTWAEILEEQLA